MKILFNRAFLKDLSKLPKHQREKIERFAFEDHKKFEIVILGPIFHKLKGFRYHYRVRFGDYRVGVSLRNNILTFERVLHRKEIYKYFP